MGEVKRCGLLNESRERADGYVIKTLPSYKHDFWNPKDFEQAKMALRFLDTGIQPMKEDGGVVGGRMMGDRANVSNQLATGGANSSRPRPTRAAMSRLGLWRIRRS
jgi:hypothetical protein